MAGLTKEQVLEKVRGHETMAEAIIEGIDFSGMDLSGADFYKAMISNCFFSSSSLRGANFSRSQLEDVDFSEAGLEGADFSRSNISGVTFMDARLQRGKFNASIVHNTLFLGARMEDSTFLESSLENANFTEAALGGSNFEECVFVHSNFWRADLNRAKFRRANLEGANFENANLMETDLTEASLVDARLYQSNMKAANLVGVDFGGEIYYERDHVIKGTSGSEKVIEKDFYKAKEVYLQIKNTYLGSGRYEEERQFYVKEMKATKRYYLQKKEKKKWLIFVLWEKICLYGEDSMRFVKIAIVQLFIYSMVYWIFGLLQTQEGLRVQPVARDLLRCIYFSAVASSTTGFGDITPLGPIGETVAASHVLLGYIMLGAMMTVLARKVIR